MRHLETQTIAGTIAVAGVSQQIAPRNPRRDLLMLQNVDAAEVIYYAFGVAAVAGASFSLSPGESIKFDDAGAVPTDAINVAGSAGTSYVLLLGQQGGIE